MTTQSWAAIADALAGKCNSISATEAVSLNGAIGRILAEPLLALQPLPAHTHAVMDGYALGSYPPRLYRLVNEGAIALAIDEASPVVAGARVPDGTAAVILARYASLTKAQINVSVALTKDNIRHVGEEAKVGAELLPANTRLDSRHTALASAAGVQQLTVRQKPRVVFLGLHDGLNSFPHAGIMHALLDSPALQLTDAGVVRLGMLTAQIKRLSPAHDLIVVVGESLGAETGPLASSIASLGGHTKLFRAALKPAKPLIAGRLRAQGETALIIGLAGTAYATATAAHLFVQPVLQKFLGLTSSTDLLPVIAGFTQNRLPGRAEALPVKLSVEKQSLRVISAGRFGQLRALASIDGFALVPETVGNITQGMPLLFKRLTLPLV